MSNNNLILKTSSLTKDFIGLRAIDNVDFNVSEGKIYGIIGPNGAGKTTFLNLISGVLPPTSVKILFYSEDVTNLKSSVVAKKGISRTFQTGKLDPNMTTLENVMTGLYVRTKLDLIGTYLRLPFTTFAQEKKIKIEALELLSLVGLKNSADRWTKQLIWEERQGEWASFFVQGEFGAKLAVKEINNAGGVRGKPLVIQYNDEGPNPTACLPIVSKAIDKNLLMVIGPMTGPNVIASMPLYKEAKILCNVVSVGTSAVLPWVAPNDPWCVSFFNYTEETITPPTLAFAARNPDMKKVVMFLYSKHTDYVTQGEVVKNTLESLGIEVITIDVLENTTNLAPIAVDALKYNANGYVFIVLEVPAAKLVKELNERGVEDHNSWLFLGTLDSTNFYEGAKCYIDNAYIYAWFDNTSEDPKWLKLKDAWAEAHPDNPMGNFLLFQDYNAITLLAKGIEECKLTGAENVRKEKQAKLREWMLNVEGFDFAIPGKCDIIGGVKNNQ